MANAMDTIMDMIKIGHRIDQMSKPKEFDEKLKGEQGKLIQTRFELMEQTNEGLNKIRELVGQSIIKDNPESFNINKYQLKKSMIDP